MVTQPARAMTEVVQGISLGSEGMFLEKLPQQSWLETPGCLLVFHLPDCADLCCKRQKNLNQAADQRHTVHHEMHENKE